MTPPPAIVSVNTADVGGGAESVALDLHAAFARAGATSRLVVGDRKSLAPDVLPLFLSDRVDYRPYRHPLYQPALGRIKRLGRARGEEDFHSPYTRHLLELTDSCPDAVLLHNLHGGYFDLRLLPELCRRVPVFWMLHDCWSFTGHCAYPVGCPRWQTGCGRCPDLTLPPAIAADATASNWGRKASVYAHSRLRVCSPTRWLLDLARRSILAPAMIDSRVVPCPVDLSLFRPRREEARRELGIDPDVPLLLFAAQKSRSNPYKDSATIERAVALLARPRPHAAAFVGLGEEAPPRRIGEVSLTFLPFQPREAVARWFQAADVYVHAAKEENFGLVTAEALACGTPVVSTATGGLPEVVRHGVTGLLVPPGDSGAMAAALARLLDDPGLRRRMGRAAAEDARRFDRDAVAATWLAWFAEAIAERRAA